MARVQQMIWDLKGIDLDNRLLYVDCLVYHLLGAFPVHLQDIKLSHSLGLHGCSSKCKVWIRQSHKRSRPLIQTPDPDLSKGVAQTFDPDLWNDIIINGRFDACSSDGCMFFGFPALQLFTPPSCQATNCCKAKLSNCNCCRARPSSNQAV